jgi:hypothetical protein
VKRSIAFITAVIGLTFLLTGCEVNQINWRNHSYTISATSCLAGGGVTLKNGEGQLGDVHVDLTQVIYADFTQDGVQDVAVVLQCTFSRANLSGSEIQVFTRNAKPIMRLIPPGAISRSALSPRFNVSGIFNDYVDYPAALITAVSSYGPQDAPCCPHQTNYYRWIWNGHVFHPVYFDDTNIGEP